MDSGDIEIYINDELVEYGDGDNMNAEDSSLAKKLGMLDSIPSTVFDGDKGVIKFILNTYPAYNDLIHNLISIEGCPSCGNPMEGVVTTDSFFIL